VLKYQGDPPCNTCLVGPMCFKTRIDEFNPFENIEVILYRPCDEGVQWISDVDYLYYFTDAYLGLPDGLLGIEDIKKIMQLGENENIEDLARKFDVSDSAMEAFKKCVSELYELLGIFKEDELMQLYIEPLVKDRFKMLMKKK
jgi:hypothetical protein